MAAQPPPWYLVHYQGSRGPSSPGLPAAPSPGATCSKSLGLWHSQSVMGPVPIFIHCNSSRVKCLVAALHFGLPASGNDPGFTRGFPEDFLLSVFRPGGLQEPVKVQILCPHVPASCWGSSKQSLTTGHPLKPPQTSGISQRVQACSAPGLLLFQSISAGLSGRGMSCVPPWSCLCLLRTV